jgi:hypothetical protein
MGKPGSRKGGCGYWRLVAVEVRAFGRRDKRNLAQRLAFVSAMALSMWAYRRRCDVSGQAVCLLEPRPLRLAGGFGGLAVVALALGATCPPVAWALVAGLASLCLPLAWPAVKALPANHRLRRMTPPGPRMYLHSLASTWPGSGAELMRSVVRDADATGKAIALDADNQKLARYYEAFGFRALGTAVTMPNGVSRVRMWRPPARPIRRP